MSPIQSFFLSFARKLVSFWRKDRIRISPVEGRLLRLQCGDQVLIDNMLYTICDSCTERRSGDLHVCYRLRYENSTSQIEGATTKSCFHGQLTVAIRQGEDRRRIGQLSIAGKTHDVWEDELTVLTRRDKG